MGCVLKDTIAVSVAILKSVENESAESVSELFHGNRMREMRREPEVPEERVPVGEKFDCHARITSKELAPIHSVKNGILQKACSTRRRAIADLGKSARMHVAKWMNNLAKSLKRMVRKSATALLKKNDLARKCTATCCQP